MIKTLMPLSFVAIFLTGCGNPESNLIPDEHVFQTTYSNEAMLLNKQNESCREKKFLMSAKEFDLHLFIQGKSEIEKRDFSPLLRGIFLNDYSVIEKAQYGENTEILFSDSGVKYRTTKIPRDINICPEDTGYSPGTIESAALNTSYYIHKTHLNFTTAVSDIQITPVKLNISPSILRSKIYTDYTGRNIKESSFMTDNAFYMPSTKSITFLPHSRTMKNDGLLLNFWEVPMIASHEYGHHLFQMIYKGNINRGPDFHGCFVPAKRSKSNRKSLNYRTVSIDDVVNSYNEAFADLISWYTLDSRERDVQGVKCLDQSRDVASPRFYNGKPKIFSDEAVQSFFSNYEDHKNGSCEDHSYQDIHVIGAIFAHNADQFLSQLTSSDREKLVLLVDWVKFLKAERKKYFLASPESYFKETLSGFLRMGLEKYNKPFDQDICDKIETIYPGLDMKECVFEKDL